MMETFCFGVQVKAPVPVEPALIHGMPVTSGSIAASPQFCTTGSVADRGSDVAYLSRGQWNPVFPTSKPREALELPLRRPGARYAPIPRLVRTDIFSVARDKTVQSGGRRGARRFSGMDSRVPTRWCLSRDAGGLGKPERNAVELCRGGHSTRDLSSPAFPANRASRVPTVPRRIRR